MKVLQLCFFGLLALALAVPAVAQDGDEMPLDLRHHVDLPQPVLAPDSQVDLLVGGYHFTLFTVWNRVAFGGLGTAYGLRFNDGAEGGTDVSSQFYAQLPIADLSLLRGGFDKNGGAAVEFSSAVLRELRYGSWGWRAMFSVGWQ